MEIDASQGSEGSLSTSYQTLILEAYGSIGEPDSVYGAGAGRLADIDSRIRTYMHEHAWDKALGRKKNYLFYTYVLQQGHLGHPQSYFGIFSFRKSGRYFVKHV